MRLPSMPDNINLIPVKLTNKMKALSDLTVSHISKVL